MVVWENYAGMEPELCLDALEVKTLKKDIEKSLRFWTDIQMLFKECINLGGVQIPEILNIEVRVKKKNCAEHDYAKYISGRLSGKSVEGAM